MSNDIYKIGYTHYKLSGIYSMSALRKCWTGELIGNINGNKLEFTEHNENFEQATSEYIRLLNIFVGNEVIDE